mgnify:CR=1 FL=1
MSSQFKLLSRKSRRPKPGFGFLLVRLIGWLLGIVGGLLIAAALVGFIVALVKAAPTLVGAMQFLEQQMAGFIVLTLLGGLLVFVLLGLAGVVLAGIGFAFNRWGTKPAE